MYVPDEHFTLNEYMLSARDIAEKLGCFAYVSSLRRTGQGKINEKK
jgi:tRNA U55 pseudouridine synthase TruB